MGNYRFRLSDMFPNSWFYKLKDMNKTKKTTTITTFNRHKKPPSSSSYYSPSATTSPPENRHFYYTPKVSHLHNSPKFPHFHNPPTKSSKRSAPNRKTIYKPSKLTESTQYPLSSSISHIILDITETKNIDFSPQIELELPLIITKPAKTKPTSRKRQASISGKKVKESNEISGRRSVSGVKLRSNSPKLAGIKRNVQKRKNLSESFAVVKSSFDPEQDFMQSMMEMIVENNIRSCKDLEELLACYLSLNSDEYHGVIVKAFEQVWFNLPDL